MPRANKFVWHTPEDHQVVLKYLTPVISGMIGEKVEVNGTVLSNPATGLSCAVAVSEISSDGSISIYKSTETGLILNTSQTTNWIAIFEPTDSRVSLILWDEFIYATNNVQAAITTSLSQDNAWQQFQINMSWANNRLVKKQETIDKKFSMYRKMKCAVKEDFCHLHVHSQYSFLDGVSTPEGIVQAAVANGQPGIALTDHGYMHGLYKFYKAARKAEITPVMGVELYCVDDVNHKYIDGYGNTRRFEYHITVLAMNNEGWFNLCKLCSTANRDHLYYAPRVDHKMLMENNAGLIILSGCFKGTVAWHLQDHVALAGADPNKSVLDAQGRSIYRYDPDHSLMMMREYRKVFGDRYYIEVHNNDFERYMHSVPRIMEMANQEKIPMVVAGDCHYTNTEDAALQSMMTKISKSSVGDGMGQSKVEKGCYFIRTKQEMNTPMLFDDSMLSRTCEVMERCKVHIPLPQDKDFKYLFPAYRYEEDEDWSEFHQSQQQGELICRQ